MRDNEIFSHLINFCNEALIHISVENKISFCSKSAELLFGCSTDKLVGLNINELFCQHNPELSLMIKNSMIQNYKDFILIENVTFNYPKKAGKFV